MLPISEIQCKTCAVSFGSSDTSFQIRSQPIQDYWMKKNLLPNSTDSESLNIRKCNSQLGFVDHS